MKTLICLTITILSKPKQKVKLPQYHFRRGELNNCTALPIAKPSSVKDAPILLFLLIFSLAVMMCSQKLIVRGGTIMWKFHKWLFFWALSAGANTSTSSCNNHFTFHFTFWLAGLFHYLVEKMGMIQNHFPC